VIFVDQANRRNPSRRYIESLEARVASLEGMIKSVRDADTNSLPHIIGEIRSGNEDLQYYAPARLSSPDSRQSPKTGFANDVTGSPLVELGKIMGTLQLEEGQVGTGQSFVNRRCVILAQPPTCR